MSEIALLTDGSWSIKHLDQHSRSYHITFAASLLLSILLVIALWPQVSHGTLLAWMLAVWLVQGGRVLYARCYLRRRSECLKEHRRWLRGFMLGAMVAGACWGLTFFSFGLHQFDPSIALLVFTVAGVTAYAGATMALVFPVAIAFELAAILPMSIWLFLQDGRIQFFMGIVVLFYFGMLYLQLRRTHAHSRKMLFLGEENETLAALLQQQKRLERENAMFRNMFETIAEPAVVHDGSDASRIVYANEAACRHFGVDHEKVLTLRPADFDVKLDREKFEYVSNVLEKNGKIVFETVHRNASGEELPVEVALSRFDYEGSRLSVSFIRNITARLAVEKRVRELEIAAVRDESNQRMEEAIAVREREFRSLAENLPDNIARFDVKGRYLYINPTHERTTGIAVSDIIGKEIPDAHANVKAAIAHVIATGCAVESVRQPVSINGETHIHEVSLVPERDAEGRIVSVLGIGRDMTNTYRMQEAIAAREQEFRSLAESSPDNIVRYDLEGRHRYLNKQLVRQLGLGSMDEVIGKRPGEFWTDGRFDQIEQAAARAVETGEVQVFEITASDENGQLNYGQVSVVPERDVNGGIIGTLAFGRDISAIRATERKLSHFVDNLPGIAYTFRLSPEGQPSFPYVSSAVREIYGLEPEEATGKFEAIHHLGHPEDQPKIEAAIAESARTMMPFRIESRVCRPGQPERWLDVRSVPEPQPDGGILWYGLMLDITERKRLEISLAAREAEFRSLAENSPDVIFRYDRDCRRIYVNRTVELLTGKTRDELLGRSPLEYAPETGVKPDRSQQCIRAVLDGGKPVELEMNFTAADGRGVTIHNVFAPEFAADGSVQSVLCLGRDVSERKQAEEKLREKFEEIVELNDRLESHARLLEEQTVEMEAAQEQLKQTEAWYRGILHSAPDGMMVVDEGGRITLVNEELERMFGFERGELAGQAMEVLLPVDMRAAHVGMRNGFIGNAARTAVPILASNLRASRKDGSEFVVDVTLSRLPENDYTAGAICASVRDVTQRQQAETELHQLNDRLEEHARLLEEQTVEMEAAQVQLKDALDFTEGVLNAVPDILFEVDREGRYLNFWLNDPSATEEQKTWMLGKTVYEMLPAEVADLAMAAICEADETGRATGKVLPIVQPNGETRWYEHSIARKHGDTPADTTFIVLSRDITERKLAELHLGDLKERLHGVLQTIPDMVWLKSAEGVYLACNPPFERFFGAKETAIVGKTDYDFVDAELADFFRRKDLDAIEANRVCINEEWVTLAENGQHVLLETRKVPLHDVSGEVVGVLGIGRDITESKQAQDALREREAFLDSLFNAIPVPVFYKDSDGRYLGFNRAYEMFYGASREQLVGKSVFDTHPRELAEIYHAKDAEVFEGSGETQQYEFKIKHANGSLRDVFFSKAAFFDVQGRVKGLIGAVIDITERKESEEALRDSEAFLRSVLDAIPIPVFYKDKDGRYLGYNKSYETFTGATPEKVIGKTIFEFTPREVAEVYQLKDDELYEQGGVQEYEFKIRSAQGELRDAIITKALFTDSRGEVRGLIGAAVDISERKQMENIMLKREQEFRALAENAPDIIMRYDLECRRTYVNPAFCKLTGLPTERLLGGIPTQYSFTEQAHAYEQALRSVLQNGEPCEHEYTWLAAGDREIISLFSIVPEFDLDGRVASVLAIGRDITERKRMEETLALREREFRTLVEHATDTVVRYGRDMRRTYANPAFTGLLKITAEEVIGTKPSDIPGGPNSSMFEENLAEVLINGKEIEFEFKWSDEDGKEICSLVNLTPEFGKDGEVESVLSVGRDISELHAYRAKIHQMAFYDTLTSLPNRALFNDRLRQMIADASWHGQMAGVMMIDMDRFKEVNDSLGHAIGDELLRETAARLSACVRSYDTVARLGGDEFAILLPEIRSGDDLGRIASKMLEMFNEPFLLEGKEVFVSGSIGIALYPDDSSEADDLLKYADSAMYFAKRSGRNNFRFYSRDLTASANQRLMLESELRRAIERKELELYYQPKIWLAAGLTIGSEALLRWKHPQRGMVPPDQFIGIAEDSGLILELGEWVLHAACATACEWNGVGKPLHKVAINLSARQFQSYDLLGTVRGVLEKTGCYPEWIELEITESLLLDEDGQVLEILEAFRAMGISIAIDDFGTGYSALSYLTRFPIDTLKIDRSFIRSVTTDNYRAELVKAILSIAHCLGQQVVAEGVETLEQAVFLQAHGCQIAQGFLYSKPLPKQEFESLPSLFVQV